MRIDMTMFQLLHLLSSQLLRYTDINLTFLYPKTTLTDLNSKLLNNRKLLNEYTFTHERI